MSWPAFRRVLVPAGFDPRDHLDPGLVRYSGLATALAHVLTAGDRKPRNPDWWVPISREQAVKLFGRPDTWAKVRDCWYARGILATDGIYAWNRRPLGYRWCEELRRRPRVGFDLTDRRAILRLEEVSPSIRGSDIEPCHYHLLEWLGRATFDHTAAERIINRLGPKKRNQYLANAQRFRTGVHNPSVSDKTGRFFNTVANMPSRMRPFIEVFGEPLVSNDVTAAQPLALGLITLWGEEFTEAIRPPRPPPPAATTGRAVPNTMATNSMIAYGYPRQSIIGRAAEIGASDRLLRYLGICQSPDLYHEVAHVLKMHCRDKKERNKVKRAFLKLLMGNPELRTEEWEERWGWLAGEWPEVAATLDRIKAGNHRYAARTLQRAESHLMVRGVGTRMMERMPDVPVFLVHDNVLTTPDHVDAVRDVITETWMQWGVRPHLKTERIAGSSR